MLVDIKCKAISSVKVNLTFDDHSNKIRLIAIDDLIDCEYNANGLRKHIVGKVIAISTVGPDPKGWYIIVDGSDDFAGNKARFSPTSILDVEILRKAGFEEYIKTPLGEEGIGYLRIMKGRLQYSRDGFNWKPIVIDDRDVIENPDGSIDTSKPTDDDTYTEDDYNSCSENEDEIEDANW